jgi:hypothetical protein
MKTQFLMVGFLALSSSAVASEDLRNYFTQDFTVSGVQLNQCGSAGGLSSIHNSKVQRVCTGQVKATQLDVVMIKDLRKPLLILAMESKLTKSIVDPEGGANGIRQWRLTFHAVDDHHCCPARSGALKLKRPENQG